MKTESKTIILITLILFTCLAFAICIPVQAENAVSGKSAQAVSLEPLKDSEFLYELVQHLYRWYIDESDLQDYSSLKTFEVWLQIQDPALDPGDNSQFVALTIPDFSLKLILKKTDYQISKLKLHVTSDAFKIIKVSRITVPEQPPQGSHVKVIDKDQMLDYLFKHRSDKVFPEGEFFNRMRLAVRNHMTEEHAEESVELKKIKEHIVFFAPLSPAANECWVFWETGRKLIRFASDIALENPAVWEHDSLATKIFDLDDQVVVSLEEVPGSNAYMTRDQVGRALYNCVVLGKKQIIVVEGDR